MTKIIYEIMVEITSLKSDSVVQMSLVYIPWQNLKNIGLFRNPD